MYAYKYVPGNTNLQEFWRVNHTDGSGRTGITLFDFNQGGKAQLVYRDETNLRIMDGSVNPPIDLIDISSSPAGQESWCRSGTGAEYPVVADVDGDGYAEIITVGYKIARSPIPVGMTNAQVQREGPLRILSSFDEVNDPWAPARKVWNQYAYNPVFTNEDASVPRYPLNPTTAFIEKDDEDCKTPDCKNRPYNNIFQQVTILNEEGLPLNLGPDLMFSGTIRPKITYNDVTDNLEVSFGFLNQGNAPFPSPIKVSTYVYKAGPPKVIYCWKTILKIFHCR